jgi:hypothetical protein
MTDQHPLTDEVIGKTFSFSGEYTSRWYDEEDMRAAADWQLKQVIEWLKTNTEDYLLEDYYSTYFLTEAFIEDLKQAMRPTTTTQEND